jgi:LysR family transcriptional regulator for metE and metH
MAPRLEVRHLQMIQAIAETGRVTEAAEMLGLTPSALSHRIREAELSTSRCIPGCTSGCA